MTREKELLEQINEREGVTADKNLGGLLTLNYAKTELKGILEERKRLKSLAIVDVERRIKSLKGKLNKWEITIITQPDGKAESRFIYELSNASFVNLTLNEYATIREVKYIVWRFNIKKEEITINKIGDKTQTIGEQ